MVGVTRLLLFLCLSLLFAEFHGESCLSTSGVSLGILTFFRLNETMERNSNVYPLCFAMIYRDFHQTFYRAGPCSVKESCCEEQNWNTSIPDIRAGRNVTIDHTYKCKSPWCQSAQMPARCFYYNSIIDSIDPLELVGALNMANSSNNMYPNQQEKMFLTIDVSQIVGYDPNFNVIKDKDEEIAIDTSCVNNDECFTPGSVFDLEKIVAVLPFCSWTPQRQYGADFARELIFAQPSNEANRTRFQLTCRYDYESRPSFLRNSTGQKREAIDFPMQLKMNCTAPITHEYSSRTIYMYA